MIYDESTKHTAQMYFNSFALYPIDVTFHFRPSPEIQITNTELALISIISQLDTARICLNALIAEHAFGSEKILFEEVTTPPQRKQMKLKK